MMSDITKCDGKDCPVKEQCYRFSATPHEFMQSYFTDSPGEIVDGKFQCDEYWGDNGKDVWSKDKIK